MNLTALMAPAANGQTPGGAGGIGIIAIYIVVFGAILYFLIIRPNKKKQKEEEQLKNSLQIGDEIVTIGGFYGKIISLKEDSVVIESQLDHTKQKIARWGIQQNLTVHENANEKPIKVKKEKKSKEKVPEEEKLDK